MLKRHKDNSKPQPIHPNTPESEKPLAAYRLEYPVIFRSLNWSGVDIERELKRAEYTEVFQMGYCTLYESKTAIEPYAAYITSPHDEKRRFILFTDEKMFDFFCEKCFIRSMIGLMHKKLPD